MGLITNLINWVKSHFQKQPIEEEQKPLQKAKEQWFAKPIIKSDEEEKQLLLNRQNELEKELKEIAERLKEINQKEVKETTEEEKQNIEELNFTPSENQLKERIYKYINDINQMRLSEFKRVVMSPTSADAQKYGLNVKGFGAQKNELLERIYNYKKMGGE